MIVYNLRCASGHLFEAWFKDAKAFASQKRGRKVECPVCGDRKIERVPAAPRLAGTRKGEAPIPPELQRAREAYMALSTLHRKIRETCEDVGPRFAEEARRIHYGEVEARGIHGEASPDEATALAEEGIPFATLPKLPDPDA